MNQEDTLLRPNIVHNHLMPGGHRASLKPEHACMLRACSAFLTNIKDSSAAQLIPSATMSLKEDLIKAELKSLIEEKKCGPIFIRLSWHDAGVYSTGKLTGGECRRNVVWSTFT